MYVTSSRLHTSLQADYGELASRHYDTDTMTLWHYDTMALWHYDTMTLWHYDTMTLWHYDTMTLWHYDTMALRHYDTMTLWHCDTMTLWHYDTMTLCIKTLSILILSISTLNTFSTMAFSIMIRKYNTHTHINKHIQKGICDIHAEQKISFMNKTKPNKIRPRQKGWVKK